MENSSVFIWIFLDISDSDLLSQDSYLINYIYLQFFDDFFSLSFWIYWIENYWDFILGKFLTSRKFLLGFLFGLLDWMMSWKDSGSMDGREIYTNYREYSGIRWWKCKRNWKAMDRTCKIREKLKYIIWQSYRFTAIWEFYY